MKLGGGKPYCKKVLAVKSFPCVGCQMYFGPMSRCQLIGVMSELITEPQSNLVANEVPFFSSNTLATTAHQSMKRPKIIMES